MNITRWNDFVQFAFIKPRIWSWTMRNKLIILLADCLQRYDHKIHYICIVIPLRWSISILTRKTRRDKRREDSGDQGQRHRNNHTMHLASKSKRSNSSNHECKQLNEIQNWLPNFINRGIITWSGKSANYNLISLAKVHKLHLAPLIDETAVKTWYAINRPEYAATCCNRI
jgi:hypothetical protein